MKTSTFPRRTSVQRAIRILPLLSAVLVANAIGQAQTAEWE